MPGVEGRSGYQITPRSTRQRKFDALAPQSFDAAEPMDADHLGRQHVYFLERLSQRDRTVRRRAFWEATPIRKPGSLVGVVADLRTEPDRKCP